jgi:hypothetical protein
MSDKHPRLDPMEPVTIYSTTYIPDTADPIRVLAFLLVPEERFFDGNETLAERHAIMKILDDAKRKALLDWYAAHAVKR